jgi:hypothetical protein
VLAIAAASIVGEVALGVLVYRFFTFWLPLVPALALLAALPALNDELPHTRRERRAA